MSDTFITAILITTILITTKRTGTLWEGRFKSCLVEDEAYLIHHYRYIELNPVRTLMVAQPSEYVWSSY
jgi:putative transposase